jgi:RHS repeat-associated protein
VDTDQESQQTLPDESRSYYSADEKLTYYNRFLGSFTLPGSSAGVFEEYRYDALGRRVFMRARRPSNCYSPCEAYAQRTVWDGDQVLYEIRSSGKEGVAAGYMESDVVTLDPGDHANLYGVVAYAHALGIDQPVGILKKYANEGTWGYVTPHANWKGEWSYGTFSDGNTCLTMGQGCPNWPGFTWSMDGSTQGTQPQSNTVWWGNTIRGKTDASGLMYMRNRYYDPRTGRFTQQDPIGLAGGMNLYGFAGGDPVNFSDPMGLCPIPADDCPPGYFTALGGAIGALVGAFTGGAGGGLGGAAAGELACAGVPVCGAAGAVAGGAAGRAAGAAAGLKWGAAVGGLIDIKVQMARAGKGRGKNANPNRDVDRIAKDNELNASGKRALHDEITGQDLSLDEIRDIARRLADQEKYRNPRAP